MGSTDFLRRTSKYVYENRLPMPRTWNFLTRLDATDVYT